MRERTVRKRIDDARSRREDSRKLGTHGNELRSTVPVEEATPEVVDTADVLLRHHDGREAGIALRPEATGTQEDQSCHTHRKIRQPKELTVESKAYYRACCVHGFIPTIPLSKTRTGDIRNYIIAYIHRPNT